MSEKHPRRQLDRRTARLAETQHGVVGRGQLEAIGLGRGAIEHRLEAGRLHRVHRGVYSVGHPLLGAEGRWMAAVLACGDGAALSHRSAAALWDLRSTESPVVDVTVASRAGRRRRPGIVVHRSRALRGGDLVRHRAIRTTSPARTLLDLADLLPAGPLERALERAEALRVLDLRELRATIQRSSTRRGSGTLAEMLERLPPDPGLTRSELEDIFLELCARHRLGQPLVNANVGGYTVDFLWTRERLIVETDGHRDHATRAPFERDRARDARLVAGGYRVVRFTYRQVTREPETVAGLVHSLVTRRDARTRALDQSNR